MAINLTPSNFLVTGAISYTFRYARIDNTNSPTFQTVANVTTDPVTLATNLPNGQYEVRGVPIFADGRVCPERIVQTDACPFLIAFNAVIQGDNIIISYTAPAEAEKVFVYVQYPNGGTFSNTYVNNGNNIAIPLPAGVYGTYNLYGQSVCDVASGFVSQQSGFVTLTRATNNTTIVNGAADNTVTAINGLTGFGLSAPLPTGTTITGFHDNFIGVISLDYTKSDDTPQQMILRTNGVIVQTVSLETTAGSFTSTFASITLAVTDLLTITVQDI